MEDALPDAGDSSPEAEAIARGARRGKRAALAATIVVSVAFIGASSAQIVPAVFGVSGPPIPAGAPGSPERECADGVRAMLAALDRAGGQLVAIAGGGDTAGALRARLSPEWDRAGAVGRACSRSREGEQAWAALQRMRVAEEQTARMGQIAIAPLRREVAAHLPPDLR